MIIEVCTFFINKHFRYKYNTDKNIKNLIIYNQIKQQQWKVQMKIGHFICKEKSETIGE